MDEAKWQSFHDLHIKKLNDGSILFVSNPVLDDPFHGAPKLLPGIRAMRPASYSRQHTQEDMQIVWYLPINMLSWFR